MSMGGDKNIFHGLEGFGFDDVSDIKLYKNTEDKKDNKNKDSKDSSKVTEDMLLYSRKVMCPVCQSHFSVTAVKTNGYRMRSRESDFYIKYDIINPYFYDVWLCNVCGYTSMKSDFYNLKNFEIELIQKNITPKWRGKKYPEKFDINIAIERYKLSLFNFSVIGAKASKKAMNCLKLSWLYRDLEDLENEKIFREQALIGFKDAYLNEPSPIYGMDSFTIMYLIGELNRRSGNYDEALKYFGNVIVAQEASRRIKDLAINQKDSIRETLNQIQDDEDDEEYDVKEANKKRGLFSRLFNLK